MKKISPCLWYVHQAEEAEKFYSSTFKNVKTRTITHYGKWASQVPGLKEGAVLTIDLEIEGLPVLALNGGPIFQHTPAMSFFVYCKDESEIEGLWKKLSQGGQVRMGLDKYPWAPKYGWVADKFGVDWQLMIGERKDKLSPAFLFVDKLFGRGQEAIDLYTSLFKNSKVENLTKAEDGKSVLHCAFTLAGQSFVLMDGPGTHNFTFSEAFSLIVYCEDQKEIDFFWDKLIADGGKPSQCGWLKDKFGVSWQITPAELPEWTKNPKTYDRVMEALLPMTKLDLATLRKAAGR